MPARILCIRYSSSRFGAAEAWLKSNGVVQEFATLREAKAEAYRLNSQLTTFNVAYEAVEV